MLSLLIALPLIGALAVMLLPSHPGDALPKWSALAFSIATLIGGAVVGIANADTGETWSETHTWIAPIGAHWALAVDGLGVTMVLLTVILVPVVIAASWHDADDRNTKGFFALMLVVEALALAVFCAQDVFLFYLVFEATLIPAYFLIGSYGHGPRRTAAAVKFLLYMLAGGLVMLAAVVALYAFSAQTGHASYLIDDLKGLSLTTNQERMVFIGFFLAFAIKAPIFPFHTWLPDTTGNATPGTSVLLICVLDKIGTYGMLRFCLELFPGASHWATPVVVTLALISIVYGALLALGQDDLLVLTGLTSLSHFGFIVLGIFVVNDQGVSGATFYMFNHGLATAVLFLAAGYLIKRTGTARLSQMGGVEKKAPVLAALLLLGGLGTLGLPGLSPFVSEFLVMLGAFQHHWWVGTIAVSGIVLAAAYVLRAYRLAVTGPERPELAGVAEVGKREIAAIAPLIALMILLGFAPQLALSVINPASDHTMSSIEAATIESGAQK
ncbi:NADH-quinone oxidoreductase subunit M [Nocardioides jejuensis]|uniref:NADH-quinone oxidoreductase subunit M n=1 Tax=Nocardioides jejuensis TaxID=2502782 RepID=A0A4V2NXL6_9ACTN|nr:NADH-quinone oxidoreductase subunit M [Nocardioides jejuensis]TCJ21742.1 NADH-quinone oxidoreductase subunit M [Nocardioides jejuensis]